MVTEKNNLIVIKKTILEDSKDDFVTFFPLAVSTGTTCVPPIPVFILEGTACKRNRENFL